MKALAQGQSLKEMEDMTNQTLDPTIQRAIDDADLDAEMETLLQNRPSYNQAVPGTNGEIEPGKTRAITSTAAVAWPSANRAVTAPPSRYRGT